MMLCADVNDAHCLQYAELPTADGRRQLRAAAAAGPKLPKGLDQAFGAGAEQKLKEAILDKKLTQLKAMAPRLRGVAAEKFVAPERVAQARGARRREATTRRTRVSRRERDGAERAEERPENGRGEGRLSREREREARVSRA